jgi:NADPH:quinone reductase-like Zn-dependent oxidoreductase
MKALRFEQTGDLGNLALVDLPDPVPGPGELLVRVRAAGLNKSDASNVMGFFPYTTVPRIPGRDFAGVVERGPVPWLGQAVFGSGKELGFTRDGAQASYIVVGADAVAPKPAALSFAQAAACGVPYVTAWHAMHNTGVTAGTRVLILGAAGGVGLAAIHLARRAGADVLAGVRHADQARRLEARGFRTLLLSDDTVLRDAVRQHFADGADVIFDTPGAWLSQGIAALARFGRFAVIVVPGDGQAKVPLRDLYRVGGSIVGVNSLLYSAAECARMFERLTDDFERGVLCAPDGVEEWPLAEGMRIYAGLRNAGGQKFVLIPD